MSNLTESERERWFTRFRAEWFRVMRPLGSWVPWELRDELQLEDVEDDPGLFGNGMIPPAPKLRDEHLHHCRVLPDRIALLHLLPKGGVVAEVGTDHGDFAREILRVVEPAEFHVIDHHLKPRARELATDPRSRGSVRLHQGDSADTLKSFEDGFFDWIYIDAQHGYEGVKRDISAAVKKIKTDGFLIFNDYAVWSYVEMQPYGVVAAVNELCVEDGWEMAYLTIPPTMYCDVAVRKVVTGRK